MTSCNLDYVGGQWQIQIPCSKKNYPWAKRIMQDVIDSMDLHYVRIFENSASIEMYYDCRRCAHRIAEKIRGNQ